MWTADSAVEEEQSGLGVDSAMAIKENIEINNNKTQLLLILLPPAGTVAMIILCFAFYNRRQRRFGNLGTLSYAAYLNIYGLRIKFLFIIII